VGGVERFHAMFRPLLFDSLRLPTPDPYRTPPGVAPENLLEHHLSQAEQVLAEHHQRIAALVIEPLVQAAAGMIVHPPGYLRGMRELTRRYDVLLVADEVAVGMGGRHARPAVPGQGSDGRIPAAGRHPDHRRDLAGVPGDLRPEQDLLPRPHLWRQSAGGGRGAGHLGRV
jgi:hypothetical protein